MRVAELIPLTSEEQSALDAWAAGRSYPYRIVQQAKIIRMAADGIQSQDISRELRISRLTIQLWRERFLALRLICVGEKIKFKLSTVLQPMFPLRPGIPVRQTYDYMRHGTTTLFAALNIIDGKVIGDCMPRHRHQEFIRFLQIINVKTPLDLELHLIVDNYGTHKHPRVQLRLKRHPRFHLLFTPVSNSWLNNDREMVQGNYRQAYSSRVIQKCPTPHYGY